MKKPTAEQWAMVIENDRLLWKWAIESTPRGLNHDRHCVVESYDIIFMQAVRASMSYRKELGLTFGTYIGKHIKKLVYRHWEIRNRKTNRPVALELVPFEDEEKEFLSYLSKEDKEIESLAMRIDVANAIKSLPKRERRLIELWAGMGCRQRTEEELSKALRVSRGRVWQLKKKAFKKIKEKLTKGKDDY